jgi:putative membrane protein
MLWIKAFHIIALVAWFAGLFYLPRLFVYHADAVDPISIQRFKIMEWRLYYAITWPAAALTTMLGIGLILFNPSYYLHAGWMHAKFLLVFVLWGFHFSCGHFRKQFFVDSQQRTARFFRMFNEIPTLLLIGIVILVVVKPF